MGERASEEDPAAAAGELASASEAFRSLAASAGAPQLLAAVRRLRRALVALASSAPFSGRAFAAADFGATLPLLVQRALLPAPPRSCGKQKQGLLSETATEAAWALGALAVAAAAEQATEEAAEKRKGAAETTATTRTATTTAVSAAPMEAEATGGGEEERAAAAVAPAPAATRAEDKKPPSPPPSLLDLLQEQCCAPLALVVSSCGDPSSAGEESPGRRRAAEFAAWAIGNVAAAVSAAAAAAATSSPSPSPSPPRRSPVPRSLFSTGALSALADVVCSESLRREHELKGGGGREDGSDNLAEAAAWALGMSLATSAGDEACCSLLSRPGVSEGLVRAVRNGAGGAELPWALSVAVAAAAGSGSGSAAAAFELARAGLAGALSERLESLQQRGPGDGADDDDDGANKELLAALVRLCAHFASRAPRGAVRAMASSSPSSLRLLVALLLASPRKEACSPSSFDASPSSSAPFAASLAAESAWALSSLASVEPAAVAAAGGGGAAASAVARFARFAADAATAEERGGEGEEYFFASLVAKEALFLLVAVCSGGEDGGHAIPEECEALLLRPQVIEGAVRLLLLATAEDETATATAAAAAAALDVLSLALDGASAPLRAAEALRAAGAKEALQAVVSSQSPPLLEQRARELLSRLGV